MGYSCSTAAINQGYSSQKKQGSSTKNKTSGVSKKSSPYYMAPTLISREMIRIKGKWYRKEVYGYRNKTYFKYIKQ